MEWPHLKWSHDSRFFARQSQDTISVYEMPNCGLLDKKSIKCAGVRGFTWAPKDNCISYWVPEQGEAPARVTLIGIPRRNEIRVKNLYNVHNIEMSWQDQGKRSSRRYVRSKGYGNPFYVGTERKSTLCPTW